MILIRNMLGKEMDEKISVIVPVYRVEKYLNRCIESIHNQTYPDLEIILVDDGSPDNCGRMCDEWKEKDTRIKVIHQENRGLSAARNAGLSVAGGEYIGFVDSDDYIHSGMYEVLLREIKKHKADLAVCNAYAFYEDEEPEETDMEAACNSTVENTESWLRHFLDDFTGPVTWTWNKLYKRDCLCGICFAEGKRMEDIRFSADLVKNLSKAVWIPEQLYYYRQRGGSIMNSGNPRILTEHGEALVYSYQVLKNLGSKEFHQEYRKNVVNRLAGLEADAYRHKYETERKELRALSSQMYREKSGNLGLKAGLVRYFPYVYYFLKNR